MFNFVHDVAADERRGRCGNEADERSAEFSDSL
jgi:hypothetical protein